MCLYFLCTESVNVEKVHLWAYRGDYTLLSVDPFEYSASTCDQAAIDFNGK